MLRLRLNFNTAAIVIVLWLLFLVVDLVKKTRLDYDSLFFKAYYLPGFLIWMLLTVVIVFFFNQTRTLRIQVRLLTLLLIGVALGIFKVMLNTTVFQVFMGFNLNGNFFPDEFESKPLFFFAESTIITWVVFVLLFVLEANQRYKDKELEAANLSAALSDSNLQALKMQIQPHFLFNSLNTITTLVRGGQSELALDMLHHLSDVFRVSLKTFETQFVSLDEEIDFIQKYLEIEKCRFEENLEVSFSIDKAHRQFQVPVFILQPLVENAIKHGISQTLGKNKITITTSNSDNYLSIKIFNTGRLKLNSERDGVGLTNVKQRLALLYPEGAKLDLNKVPGGVEALLTIPLTQ